MINKKSLQQNPSAANALYLALLTIPLVIWTIAEMWIISFAIFAYQIRKAKKANEDVKFISAVNKIVLIPVMLIVIKIAFFVISNLK